MSLKNKIENWLKKNKSFAVALPLVLLLGGYFIVNSFTKIADNKKVIKKEGYNNNLPFKKDEIDVKNPHEYYKKGLKDSLMNNYESGFKIRNLKENEKEKDSFKNVLKSLSDFSFNETPKTETSRKKRPVSIKKDQEPVVSGDGKSSDTSEKDMKAWRERKKKENEEFFNSASASYQDNSNNNISNDLQTDNKIYAVIYRDQNVIDKGRVSMRLGKDAVINGIKFKRNTIFFGFIKFAKNRVYINVNEINDISVNLLAYDAQDNNKGIYTEIKFKGIADKEIQDNAVDEVNTNKIPLGNTVKNLFKKNNAVDEMPLSNEYKLILKSIKR